MESQREPPILFGNLIRKQHDASDVHSVRTTTNSDSKSLHTATFTASTSHASSHSETSSNPPRSRAQSPVRFGSKPTTDMDLLGILSHRDSPHAGERHAINLPSRPLLSQPSSNHSTVDEESTRGGRSMARASQEAMNFDEDEELISSRGSETCTPYETTPMDYGMALEAVGDRFEDVPSPISYTFIEDSSTRGTSDDGDLHLEKIAGDLLSEWFGVSIESLERPIRVIHALEQVKDQVASIVEEDGHILLEDMDEANDQESDGIHEPNDVETDRRDASDTGPSFRRDSSLLSSSPSRSGSQDRPLNNGDLESSSSARLRVKTRNSNKKRRLGLNFSCPYRKRNPCRFNVRDHERCAIRSYSDMASLKRHLISDHYKPARFWHTCSRCQLSHQTLSQAYIHVSQCRASPQIPTVPRILNPEDGFDDDIKTKLISRKESTKIGEWRQVYRLLFQNAEIIPEPDFEPVVEDHEIIAKIKDSKAALEADIERLAAQHIADHASRNLLRFQITQLIQNRDTKLLDRQDMYFGTALNDTGSGSGSSVRFEDDFIHVRSGSIVIGDESRPTLETVNFPAHIARNSTPIGDGRALVHQEGQNNASYSGLHRPLLPVAHEQHYQQQINRQSIHTLPVLSRLEGAIDDSAALDGGLSDVPMSAEFAWMPYNGPLSPNNFTQSMFSGAEIQNNRVIQNGTWTPTAAQFVPRGDIDWNRGPTSYDQEGWETQFRTGTNGQER